MRHPLLFALVVIALAQAGCAARKPAESSAARPSAAPPAAKAEAPPPKAHALMVAPFAIAAGFDRAIAATRAAEA